MFGEKIDEKQHKGVGCNQKSDVTHGSGHRRSSFKKCVLYVVLPKRLFCSPGILHLEQNAEVINFQLPSPVTSSN